MQPAYSIWSNLKQRQFFFMEARKEHHKLMYILPTYNMKYMATPHPTPPGAK